MIVELQETNWKLHKGLINLQSHCFNTIVMESRVRKTTSTTIIGNKNTMMNEGMQREREYYRSFSHGNGKKTLKGSYFGLESMLLLVCLTASLLILPLVLPPLPPPPFMLLLLPIGIFAVLMILAFTPSNVRDLTYTYM